MDIRFDGKTALVTGAGSGIGEAIALDLARAGAKVIVIAHLGRPKGEPDPAYSLRPVAARMAELLGADVALAADVTGDDARAKAAALQDGQVLQPRLLVAADSRFSETRRQLGIGAQLKDFGKTMLVCRMQHEHDHQQVAWEWFGYGQTLALLPLNGRQSSVVLTLPPREIERLWAEEFAKHGAKTDRTRRLYVSRYYRPAIRAAVGDADQREDAA